MTHSLFWLISLLVVVFDQSIKIFVCRQLFLHQSIPVIRNVFHISLVYNTGIAFGLFKNKPFIFLVLSLSVICYILADFVLNARYYSPGRVISLGLLFGGAAGNLIDRIFRGYIVDFLDFRIWPVFNIADSAITVGMIFFAIDLLFKPKTQDAGRKTQNPF